LSDLLEGGEKLAGAGFSANKWPAAEKKCRSVFHQERSPPAN